MPQKEVHLVLYTAVVIIMVMGISFLPYKTLFQAVSSKELRYLEVHNASEGFFAVQDQVDAEDMLLLLDHGVFYEFIPLDEVSTKI